MMIWRKKNYTMLLRYCTTFLHIPDAINRTKSDSCTYESCFVYIFVQTRIYLSLSAYLLTDQNN